MVHYAHNCSAEMLAIGTYGNSCVGCPVVRHFSISNSNHHLANNLLMTSLAGLHFRCSSPQCFAAPFRLEVLFVSHIYSWLAACLASGPPPIFLVALCSWLITAMAMCAICPWIAALDRRLCRNPSGCRGLNCNMCCRDRGLSRTWCGWKSCLDCGGGGLGR